MNRPPTVRIGLTLLLLALILRGAVLVVFIPRISSAQGPPPGVGAAVASLLFYAAFVYAMSQRRNWARLVFAFLYVAVGMVGFIAALSPQMSMLALWQPSGPQLAVLLLVGAGMIFLFLPSAADWYHGRERSSLTRA